MDKDTSNGKIIHIIVSFFPPSLLLLLYVLVTLASFPQCRTDFCDYCRLLPDNRLCQRGTWSKMKNYMSELLPTLQNKMRGLCQNGVKRRVVEEGLWQTVQSEIKTSQRAPCDGPFRPVSFTFIPTQQVFLSSLYDPSCLFFFNSILYDCPFIHFIYTRTLNTFWPFYVLFMYIF